MIQSSNCDVFVNWRGECIICVPLISKFLFTLSLSNDGGYKVSKTSDD